MQAVAGKRPSRPFRPPKQGDSKKARLPLLWNGSSQGLLFPSIDTHLKQSMVHPMGKAGKGKKEKSDKFCLFTEQTSINSLPKIFQTVVCHARRLFEERWSSCASCEIKTFSSKNKEIRMKYQCFFSTQCRRKKRSRRSIKNRLKGRSSGGAKASYFCTKLHKLYFAVTSALTACPRNEGVHTI